MIVSRKIAEMFKHPGFVNIDNLVENKLETNPSKILNIINRDWRKWVKPRCMFDGGRSLDPNFGYETLGTTQYMWIRNYITGSVFTITEAGVADSITAGLYWSIAEWTGNVKCASYLHSDLSLVTNGVTEERAITLTSTPTWYTFNFGAPKPNLTANTEYILVAWSNLGIGGVSTITGDAGDPNQGHYQNITYDTFPDPFSPYHDSNKYSIYCTYTVVAPPPPKPKGTISIHGKLAVGLKGPKISLKLG